jgi:hypothetical protein
MKYLLISLSLLCVFACKSPNNEKEEVEPILVNESSLRLFGPDGKKILSGTGTIQKKWEILRFYTALDGDQSTVTETNIGLINSATQKDLLSNLPSELKNANVSFETSAVGINGYGGISDGSFKVLIPSGQIFMSQTGIFSIENGVTPFYQTNFGFIVKNKKVIPVFYLENTKLKVGSKEFKGEFLQLISPENNNFLDFPTTVVLLFSPS